MIKKFNTKVKERLINFFDWIKGAELIELKSCDVKEDPVRPELSLAFRNSKTRGREIYALVNDKGGYASVVCIAHCKFVPKSVDELKKFSDPTGNIAIAYTVWSNTKGAGKTIIDHLLKINGC